MLEAFFFRRAPGKTFAAPGNLDLSISRLRTCLQCAQKIAGDGRDAFDRGKERSLVRFRRLVETADLSDELQRSGANFFFRHRRREIEKELDIATHGMSFDAFGGCG